MAKTDTPRRSKRQRKVVKVVEEEDNANIEGKSQTVSSNEQIPVTEEDNPTKSTEVEMIQEEEVEDQNEQDPEMNTVIEVKGNTPTVNVSWEKKNEEGEGDDAETRTNTVKEMTDSEEQTQISSPDAVGSTEEAPSQAAEPKLEQEMEECGGKQESQMDTTAEDDKSTPTVTITWQKNEEGDGDNEKESDGGGQITVKEAVVNGKRKANSTAETSPSKKTKLINDGFCVFVGNLNNSKTFEEVKDSLANYLMTQSLLFQDIRLDRSRKHAFVDLASEMDLNKALTLNGETILDKPMKIAKAKIKSEDKVKVKPSPLDKKAAKDARCLFLKNVPYNTTKADILKIFNKGVAVRFPGGTEGPSQGIAFVEFSNRTIAKKVRKRKQGVKIRGRVLIVDCVGESNVSKAAKAKDDNKHTKAAAPPNNTLFVSSLSSNVKEKHLKNAFQKAVTITIPQNKGKPRGFAFVEFANVADAEKALQSSKDTKICKKAIQVQFSDMRAKPEKVKVLSKTLIIMGLAEKTTAETLQSAFEGAVKARVAADKETGVSKRFGFVDFESEEICKAAKEAMADCRIDGSKVTVAYAKSKGERGRPGARGGLAGRPSGQSAGPGAGRGERGGRGGSLKGGRGSRRGRGRGAGKSRDAVKEVECKN